MILTLNTPKGKAELKLSELFYGNLYDATRPGARVSIYWPDAKDLDEAEENTVWLMTQMASIPTLLPL